MEDSMNIGSNGVKKALICLTATAIASLISTTALAGPNQLDILGLIPGVSELAQVQQADFDQNRKSKDGVMLEIGGYKIPCGLSFLNGKLASLVCPTGTGTTGSVEYKYTEASNIEVHSALTSGFTKKLGKPDSIIREAVRTGMGVEHENQLVTWIDKRGNKLQLISIDGNIKKGLITLMSSELLKQLEEKDAADNARKKF